MNEDYIYAKISEEESNNGEEATNITEIISLLDELRENCTQGDWKWEYGDNGLYIVTAEEGYKFATFFQAEYIINTAYVTAIHNNYKALRQAALDGERYREAAEFWKNEAEIQKDSRLIRDKQCKALAEAMERLQLEFKANACECGEEWKDTDAHDICNNALEAYRQAVEQKEV
jgi:hypothetical protein